jgi:hypothetical protein
MNPYFYPLIFLHTIYTASFDLLIKYKFYACWRPR